MGRTGVTLHALRLKALRFRATQSILLVLLTMAAVAACALGPMHERAVEQAALRSTLRAAPVADRSVQITGATSAEALGYLPDGAAGLFDPPITSQQYPLSFPAWPHPLNSGLLGTAVARTDACRHLTVVAGRCATGPAELMMSAPALRTLGFHVGETMPVQLLGARRIDVGRFTVVGSYRVPDPADSYWFGRTYQTRTGTTPVENGDKPIFVRADPAFVSTVAITAIARTYAAQAGQQPATGGEVDLAVDPARLSVDDIGALRDALAVARTRIARAHPVGDPARGRLVSRLPELLSTVDQGRRQTRVIIPTLIAQLALMIVLLLGLVIAVAVDQRRPELALARLRGGSRSAAARFIGLDVALLVGPALVLGFGLAWLTDRTLIRAAFPGIGIEPEWRWPVFTAGVGVALVTVVIADVTARHAAGQPVQDLLRTVARVRPGRGQIGVEAAVSVAAAGGVVVALTGGRHNTAALVTPGLLAILAGLVLSRLAVVVARRAGGRALWRRRTSTALTALSIARSPNVRRIVVLVCVAVALTVAAVDQWSVARTARQARADVEVGAPVVLTVETPNPQTLVRATAKADPTGDYAMPALEHRSTPQATPVLAVVASRLRRIAEWGSTARIPSPTEVGRLTPPAPPPISVSGRRLELDLGRISVTAAPGVEPRPTAVSLRVYFRRPDGALTDVATPALTGSGPKTVTVALPDCAPACQLTRIEVVRALGDYSQAHIAITFTGARVDGRAVDLRRAVEWSDVDTLAAASNSGTIAFHDSPAGLVLTSDNNGSGTVVVQHLDRPVTIPCLVAGSSTLDRLGRQGLAVDGIDGVPTTCRPVGSLPFAPRVGPAAVVVDLDRAIGASTGQLNGTTALIFLSRDDPGRERRLRAELSRAGLTVASRQTAAARLATYDQAPPAWAVQVALVVAGAATVVTMLMIVLVAFMSRRTRRRDLTALRLVGVPARTVRRAVIAEQVIAVLSGVVLGAVVGVVGARLAVRAVPLFVHATDVPGPDLGTAWGPVTVAVVGSLILLLAGAVGAAFVLGRRLTSAPTAEVVR